MNKIGSARCRMRGTAAGYRRYPRYPGMCDTGAMLRKKSKRGIKNGKQGTGGVESGKKEKMEVCVRVCACVRACVCVCVWGGGGASSTNFNGS